jgi:hypothetical protein
MRRGMAIIGAMALGMASIVEAASQHTVMVTLNYDFSVDNACSATVTTGCVQQFNIYDNSGGGTPLCAFLGGCAVCCVFAMDSPADARRRDAARVHSGPGVETSAEYLPGVESYRGGAGN